jgi:predicted DNA-binding transcriptional regulator AlpA
MAKILLSKKDVADVLGKSTRTIDRWIREGKFPPGMMKCGRPYWLLKDVESWIRD